MAHLASCSLRTGYTPSGVGMRLMRWGFVSMLAYALLAGAAVASTHYIAANGSDNNDGASQASPWAHAPGMNGCTGTCASYTPRAGDQFIFRGGDSWTITGPWNWTWSGASGNNIVLGVDKSWFSGASWSRPILNGNGRYPGGGSGFFLDLGTQSNVDVNNLEFTGLNWSVSLSGEDAYIAENGGTNVLVHDNYFHGWSHSAGVAENNNANALFTGSHSFSNKFYNNVIDGSDTARDSFGGVYGGGFGEIYQNYFAWIDNGMNIAFIESIHDNVFSNTGVSVYPGGVSHNNVMESNVDAPGMLLYNNLFSRMNPNASGGIGIQLAPQRGTTTYFFNNVLVDELIGGNQLMCGSSLNNAGGSCAIFNNTEECGADPGASGYCVRMGSGFGTPPAGASIINNHWITTASVTVNADSTCGGGCSTTLTPNPQTHESLSTANAQGYSLGQTYPFSPTAGGMTIGAGTNEMNLCSTISGINSAAGTACKSDTTVGVGYDGSSHTVNWPNRSPKPRPSTGAWDAGAYFFGTTSTAQDPNPPTGLSAVVQ
jgi:hypothetical protein